MSTHPVRAAAGGKKHKGRRVPAPCPLPAGSCGRWVPAAAQGPARRVGLFLLPGSPSAAGHARSPCRAWGGGCALRGSAWRELLEGEEGSG